MERNKGSAASTVCRFTLLGRRLTLKNRSVLIVFADRTSYEKFVHVPARTSDNLKMNAIVQFLAGDLVSPDAKQAFVNMTHLIVQPLHCHVLRQGGFESIVLNGFVFGS